MKPYDETLLKNQRVQQLARDWADAGLIDEGTLQTIREQHARVPYRPAWPVWVGLFLFSLFAIGSGTILLTPFMLLEQSGLQPYGFALYGLGLYFFLNFQIKDRGLYFSGIDNALLYSILLTALPLIGYAGTSLQLPTWNLALLHLPLLAFLAYRYGEPVLAVGTLVNVLAVVGLIAMEYPSGKLLLPFLMMAVAGISWLQVHRLYREPAPLYWRISLNWLYPAVLVVLYAAGNYLVVREGNALINDIQGILPEIAFAGLFWLLTFAVPVLYLYLGWRWRYLSLLVVGTLALVASLVTLHRYHPVLSNEWALTLLGAVGLGLAMYLIRRLKVPRNGFVLTLPPRPVESTPLTAALTPELAAGTAAPPTGPAFGGGDFGGGGSGAGY
jgi:hypothetical protein